MKSLVRWSATLGLVGTALLGSFGLENLKALALPEAQVAEKLQAVPVFTVTDPQGAPLVATVPDGQNQAQAVAGVFISQKDAQAFVQRLQKDKPDLAKNVQVVPVSLAQIVKLKQENQNKPDGLNFAFIPAQQQVQSAQAIMGQSGQQGQPFQGTPLFVARGGQGDGYLTVQENGKQVIPFFFDKEQLQAMVDRFKQQQPNLASTVKVEAVPLEGVIYTLQTSNNQELSSIVIVPSQESISFLRSLPASQNAPQQRQQRR
ncbi:MAG: Tic22 family protein [Cyanobacteriota bacterium]